MSGRKSSGMWIEQLGEECSLDRTLHPGESWWRVSTELGKWCLGSVPIRISPPILSWQSSNWGVCSYFYHNWKYPLLEGLKSGPWVLGVEYSVSILNFFSAVYEVLWTLQKIRTKHIESNLQVAVGGGVLGTLQHLAYLSRPWGQHQVHHTSIYISRIDIEQKTKDQ